MKRTWLVIALAVGGATQASAQLIGMPVWNSPSGGSGLTINGDYGKPNTTTAAAAPSAAAPPWASAPSR